MQLIYITIAGTMTGPAWGGFDAETEFNQDFLIEPNEANRNRPFATYWDDIREALLHVTSWGDVIGGMGEIQDASITFHFAGEGRSRAETFELKPGRYTHDFFAGGNEVLTARA